MMKDTCQHCAELLSAAFEIPVFLVLKGKTGKTFANSIHRRIYLNWFIKNRVSTSDLDSYELAVKNFLSALASGLRKDLYAMSFRKQTTSISTHVPKPLSSAVIYCHTELMGSWLEDISFSSLISLATNETQRLNRARHLNDIDVRAKLAWSFVSTNAQGKTFRKLYFRMMLKYQLERR